MVGPGVAAVRRSPRPRRRGRGAGARSVVLHTDLANPVSNAIYPRLGFRPVHDVLRSHSWHDGRQPHHEPNAAVDAALDVVGTGLAPRRAGARRRPRGQKVRFCAAVRSSRIRGRRVAPRCHNERLRVWLRCWRYQGRHRPTGQRPTWFALHPPGQRRRSRPRGHSR